MPNTRPARVVVAATTLVALVATLATVTTASATASTTTVIPLPFLPRALSDNDIVVGYKTVSDSINYHPYRYFNGASVLLPEPDGDLHFQPFAVNSLGATIGGAGDNTTGNQIVLRWPNATDAPAVLPSTTSWLDDLGRTIAITQGFQPPNADGTSAPATTIVRSDGVGFPGPNIMPRFVGAASDGGFVTYGEGWLDIQPDPALSRYFPPTGATSVQLPLDLADRITSVADAGNLGLIDPTTGTCGDGIANQCTPGAPDLVTVVGSTITHHSHPIPGSPAIETVKVNSHGRMVASGRVPNDPRTHIWSSTGNEWTDLTSQFTPTAGTTSLDLVAVNEWGDMIVSYQGDSGSGALITTRVPLTGQIASLTNAGGGSNVNARGVLAAKTVAVTDGPVPLTASVNAKGQFTIPMPPGIWTLTAPKGSCLQTAHGCATTSQVSVDQNAQTANLAKVTAIALASLKAKAGATIKSAGGKVPLSVTCGTVACKVTLTLKSGTKTIGTAKATIKAGTLSKLTIKLTTPATSTLKTKHKLPIAANLTVTAGTAKATIITPLTLKG